VSLVTLDPGAGQAVKSLLAKGGVPRTIRIDLRFSGCCDPSLGLMVDTSRESDLVQEVDGLTFVIDPETHELAGEVRISLADDREKTAFILTSSKPISEWEGVITCDLRM
jgi:Fe-S cluster assembly iron-binding protein IscA